MLAGLVMMSGCNGTPPAAGPRTGATAASELRDYAQFVRDVHPAPWRFTTASAFDARVDVEATALQRLSAPSDLDVARAFQRTLAELHDGHVALTSPSFQPGAAASFLPLLVKDVEGELLVDAAASAPLAGTTILAIDGTPVDEIRHRLLPLVLRDGVNDIAQLRGLEHDFTQLYHVTFGMAPQYRVQVHAGGADQEVVLKGVSREQVQALHAQRRSAPVRGAPPRDERQLPFKLPLLDGVTWIRMPSFGSPDQIGYQAEVDALVAASDRTGALIIDLRGNEGGLRTHGIALLNHVLSQPYRQWTRMTTRVRELPERYVGRATGAFGADLRALEGFPEPPVGGDFVLEGDPLAGRMIPTDSWTGPVVVLADGRTNSAANELVIALKHARPQTKVLGEEPAGNCGEHIGEIPTAWTTPTFGISILMSVIRLEHVTVPGCVAGQGLAPDVVVQYSRGDFDAGKDPYVAAVVQALE